MNKMIYSHHEEPAAKCIHVSVALLLFSVLADTMAFGQSAGSVSAGVINPESVSSGTNAEYLTVLSVIVAILAAITTVAILIPTILAFVEMQRVEREWKRFKKMADDGEERINALRESLSDFRSPRDILKEAADKAEAITETEVQAIRGFLAVFEANVKERLNKLQSAFEREKISLDELTTSLNSIKLEIEKKPSVNDILVQIGNKYKFPDDLMPIFLQRVSLAFACLRNLPDEERKEITKVLAVNPMMAEPKKE